MNAVPIHAVRDFAKKVGARGAVVLVFSGGQFGWTSYGASEEDCDRMRRFAEELMRPVEEGRLSPWSG
jgi:hypothetical protein